MMPSGAENGQKRSQGLRVIKFIEKHCVHTNGEWIGRPFRLLLWQKLLIMALFAVGDDGLRLFRWALIGIAKKNGKTELAAAIALYLLIADGEPAALVVCAAASDDQADLVYGAAKTMCEMSPTLKLLTVCYDKEIHVPSMPGAKLLRVAAAAGTNDGKNIHAVICDELHEWTGPKGRNVWTVLTNGLGARRQPLILQITTAGYDLEGTICGEQYTYGKQVQNGTIDDPRYFFYWIEPPEGADYKDPATWKAANPSYGVLVHESFFKDQLGKKREGEFKRYFLNIWTASEETWLPDGAWLRCKGEVWFDPGLPLYLGIDLGRRHDSAAVGMAQKRGATTLVAARIWENPYPPKHSQYMTWSLNIAEVEKYIRELRMQFPRPAVAIDDEVMDGPGVYYDPFYFERSAQELARQTDDGPPVAMVELPQNHSRMIPVSQTFFDLIIDGQIEHDGDPKLATHVGHVIADETGRGARMSKPKGSPKKIDAAIATAIAVWAAQQDPPVETKSVYEERGLLVL